MTISYSLKNKIALGAVCLAALMFGLEISKCARDIADSRKGPARRLEKHAMDHERLLYGGIGVWVLAGMSAIAFGSSKARSNNGSQERESGVPAQVCSERT
jgi:hypothetical protein